MKTSFYDCKCGTSFDSARGNRCPTCREFQDGAIQLRRVNVGVSKHKCDVRCTGAKGHICNCECGGKNHGIGRSLLLTRADACDEVSALL